MTANLHLPEGKRIAVRGRVVRSFRVPSALARLVPSGFSIRLSDTPEDYFQFLPALDARILSGLGFCVASRPTDERGEVAGGSLSQEIR